MRWPTGTLAILAGFGAAIQIPHLEHAGNLIVFVVLLIQMVFFGLATMQLWSD